MAISTLEITLKWRNYWADQATGYTGLEIIDDIICHTYCTKVGYCYKCRVAISNLRWNTLHNKVADGMTPLGRIMI